MSRRQDVLDALKVDDSVKCKTCRKLLRIAQAAVIYRWPSDEDGTYEDMVNSVNDIVSNTNNSGQLTTLVGRLIERIVHVTTDSRDADESIDYKEPGDIDNACMLDQCAHILRTFAKHELKIPMDFCIRRSNVTALLLQCYNSFALKENAPSNHPIATGTLDTLISTISNYDGSSRTAAIWFGYCDASPSELLAMSACNFATESVPEMLLRKFDDIELQVRAFNIPAMDGQESAQFMQRIDDACEAVCRVFAERQDPYSYADDDLWKIAYEHLYSSIAWNELKTVADEATKLFDDVIFAGYDLDTIKHVQHRAEHLPAQVYPSTHKAYWRVLLHMLPCKYMTYPCNDQPPVNRLMHLMDRLRKEPTTTLNLLKGHYINHIHRCRRFLDVFRILHNTPMEFDDKSKDIFQYYAIDSNPFKAPYSSVVDDIFPQSLEDNQVLKFAACVKRYGYPITPLTYAAEGSVDLSDIRDFNCPFGTIHDGMQAPLQRLVDSWGDTATQCRDKYLGDDGDTIFSAYIALHDERRDERCTAMFQACAMQNAYFEQFKTLYDALPLIACLLADALPITKGADNVSKLLGKTRPGIYIPVDVTFMATMKTLIIETMSHENMNIIEFAFHHHVDCDAGKMPDFSYTIEHTSAVLRACTDMPTLGYINVRVAGDNKCRYVILGKYNDTCIKPCDKCVRLTISRTGSGNMYLQGVRTGLPYMHGYFEAILRHMVYTYRQ